MITRIFYQQQSSQVVIAHFQKTKKKIEKMKKTPGDIIILHMCAKIYDQMIYGS